MGKAQLTMFIILGMVIVAIFAFVFFASGQVQSQRTSQQVEDIVSQILESTPLKFYINFCAEKAMETGIDLITKQGGKIFPGQNGSLLTNQEKSYLQREQNKTYFISYGVLKENTSTPQYPCKPGYENYDKGPAYCYYARTLQDGTPITKFSSMTFGIANFPALCKNLLSGCNYRQGANPQFSVQAELESYISAYVKSCVNFQSISEFSRVYNFSEGNVSANITFSDTEISAKINFPVIVTPLKGQPIIQLLTFQTSVPTRFALLYGLARETVQKDVQNASFKVIPGFNGIAKLRVSENSGFEIQKIENITMFDTFFSIIDKTVTSGQQLIFQFLQENRPPVLEYLYPPKEVDTGCGVFDVYAIEGTNLTLNPKAFDTEDNPLKFYYGGWLYNYSEIITALPSQIPGGCPVIANRVQTKLADTDTRRLIPNSTGYSTIHLTEEDLGFHNITIKVCDAQYCDWQIIRILVDDLLKIKIAAKNPFGTELFSIEDPYTFTANISDVYLNTGGYNFKWYVRDLSGILYTNESASQKLELPLVPYTIENIVQMQNISPKTGKLFERLSSSKTYMVLSTVSQMGNSASDERSPVIPVQCIPYSNPNSKYPYPYNDDPNPFLSSHLCCDTDNTYADQNTPCYTPLATYGSYNSFSDSKYQKTNIELPIPTYSGFTDNALKSAGNPLAVISVGLNPLNPVIYTNSNDIFNRTFVRLCDGKRGNMCNGTMVEKRSVAVSCSDKDAANHEIASCRGPSEDLLKQNSETESKTGCDNYGARVDPVTFENLTLHWDIRCNSQSKCVSDDSADNGYSNPNSKAGVTPHFICNATCGTTGCTRTISKLCTNCYLKQTCVADDDQISHNMPSPADYHQFTYSDFDPTACSNGICSTTTKTTRDSCNGNILADYRCLTQNELKVSNTGITYESVDCTSYNRQDAIDNGGDNLNPSNPGTCSAQGFGVCSTNIPGGTEARCIPPTWLPPYQEGYSLSQSNNGNYVFVTYSAVSKDCVRNEINLDQNSMLCESLTYNCIGVGVKQGDYQGNYCYGSHLVDRQAQGCQNP